MINKNFTFSLILLATVFLSFSGLYFMSHIGGHTCPFALISGIKCLFTGAAESLEFIIFHLKETRDLFQPSFVLNILVFLFLPLLFLKIVCRNVRPAACGKNNKLELFLKNGLNFEQEKIKFLSFKPFFNWLSLHNKIMPEALFN